MVCHLENVDELREGRLVFALLGAVFLRQLCVILGVRLELVHELVKNFVPVAAPVEPSEHVVLRGLHVPVVPPKNFWIRVKYLAHHDCVHGVPLVVELVLELSYYIPLIFATSAVADLNLELVSDAPREEPVSVNLQDATTGHPNLLAEVVHVRRADLLHGVLDRRNMGRVLLAVVRELVVVVRPLIHAIYVALQCRAVFCLEIRLCKPLAILVHRHEAVLFPVNSDYSAVVWLPLELLWCVPEHTLFELLRHNLFVVIPTSDHHANVFVGIFVWLAHCLQPVFVRHLPCQNSSAHSAACNVMMRGLLRSAPRVHPCLEGFGKVVRSGYRLRVKNALRLVAQ